MTALSPYVYPDGTMTVDWPADHMTRPGSPAGEVTARNGEPACALWTVYAGALGTAECDGLINAAAGRVSPHPARGNGAGSQLEAAHAGVVDTARLARVAGILHAANRAWWRLDVDEVRFKLLRYTDGDQIGEHRDMFPGSMCRKVSATVQLSAPHTYEGGRLELGDGRGGWRDVSLVQGTAVVFPAWTPHRVTPTVAGERWSLVLWGYGPPVR